MKKWLPFVLILFGFNQIGFAGLQKYQTLAESYPRQATVSESIFQQPIDFHGYEGIKKNGLTISTSFFENQLGQFKIKDYLSELQLNQESYPVSVQNDLPEDEKALTKKNNRIEDFDLGSGFSFNMPFWVVGISILFIIYTIFISLRFFSIYFQEVSTKEQLEIISGDFDSYKRNTIEKERKLMRDLIDAKNKINDLSQQAKDF